MSSFCVQLQEEETSVFFALGEECPVECQLLAYCKTIQPHLLWAWGKVTNSGWTVFHSVMFSHYLLPTQLSQCKADTMTSIKWIDHRKFSGIITLADMISMCVSLSCWERGEVRSFHLDIGCDTIFQYELFSLLLIFKHWRGNPSHPFFWG